MRDSVRNFLVGVFSIGALVGVSALLMMFGELDRVFKQRYTVTIDLNNGGGIRAGSLVTYNGVPIGQVDSLTLKGDIDHPVRVHALVGTEYSLPGNVSPVIQASLIGGGATLELQSQGATSLADLPKDGSAAIKGVHLSLAEQISAELDRRTQPLIDSLESFNRLSAAWTDLGQNLNELVRPGDPGDETPTIRTAVIKLNETLDHANEAIRLASGWLGDEQIRLDASSAVHKASALLDQASQTVDRYAKLADQFREDSHQVVTRLTPLMDEMSRTLEQVRVLARQAAEGDGTVGLLLNNPDLYNSLNDAAGRLQRTLSLVESLVEKIKAEGLTIEF